jgi:hypothetical protein
MTFFFSSWKSHMVWYLQGDGEIAPTLTSSNDGVGVVPSLPSTALQVAQR